MPLNHPLKRLSTTVLGFPFNTPRACRTRSVRSGMSNPDHLRMRLAVSSTTDNGKRTGEMMFAAICWALVRRSRRSCCLLPRSCAATWSGRGPNIPPKPPLASAAKETNGFESHQGLSELFHVDAVPRYWRNVASIVGNAVGSLLVQMVLNFGVMDCWCVVLLLFLNGHEIIGPEIRTLSRFHLACVCWNANMTWPPKLCTNSGHIL